MTITIILLIYQYDCKLKIIWIKLTVTKNVGIKLRRKHSQFNPYILVLTFWDKIK